MALRLYGLRVRLGPYRDDRGGGRDMDEREQEPISANAQMRKCAKRIYLNCCNIRKFDYLLLKACKSKGKKVNYPL